MGTTFAIYKRSKKSYALGKPRHGFAPGLEPTEDEIIREMNASFERSRALTTQYPDGVPISEWEKNYTETMKWTNPGWVAMWSIMGTGDYSVFKMSKWSREELGDILYRAIYVPNRESAIVTADHLLTWAGDEDCVLMDEDHSGKDFADIGFPKYGYKETASIWTVDWGKILT